MAADVARCWELSGRERLESEVETKWFWGFWRGKLGRRALVNGVHSLKET